MIHFDFTVSDEDAYTIMAIMRKEIINQRIKVIEDMLYMGREDIIEWRHNHIQNTEELIAKMTNTEVKE